MLSKVRARFRRSPGQPVRNVPIPLTAAVATFDTSWRDYKGGDLAWQADAWRLYDITGQLRFVAGWVGNSVSRCTPYVATVNDDGSNGPPTTNPTIAGLAALPLGEGDAKAEALRQLAVALFVAGEAYIIAESTGVGLPDRWWVVTSRHIKKQGDVITIRRSPFIGGDLSGGTMTYRHGTDLILRVWCPHPADPSEPDSPTRSAIPDLREIEAIRKRVFAELDSRLIGSGLLALPESLELPVGDDDPIGAEGFSALLGRTMAQSLRDRTSAEAMVPIIITGPGDDIAHIRHITMWSELSESLGKLRQDAMTSLAQSLDIPPEILLGLGSTTNHWNAWAISREAVQIHIKPVLTRIAAALTEGYLRPALLAMGEDPSKFALVFDTADLTTDPNRSADSVTLHDRLLLSDEVTRSANAWSPGDAPTQEERAVRLTEKLFLTDPSVVLSDPRLCALIGLPSTPTTTQPEPIISATGDQSVKELGLITRLAVRRALGLAGNRLVPHTKRPPNHDPCELHVRHGSVPEDKVPVLLAGPWRHEFAEVDDTYGLDEGAFIHTVESYCAALLERGIAYDPEDINGLLYTLNMRSTHEHNVAGHARTPGRVNR